MMMELSRPAFILLNLSFLLSAALALTNSGDVAALQNLYSTLSSTGSLTSWTSSNGDPCGQSWKGIQCSGSAVTQINLSGLGLTGQLGYNMGKLTSLTVMDFSNNQISGDVPYSLPPNLQTLNLGSNTFAGNLPYSISAMTSLVYLYAGHNQLTGNLQDMFSKLTNLSILDLSFNTISGQLPQSFSTLYNLTSLYLQNNQFTGNLNVLANLQLQDLNVESNQFTGWVPASFSSIPNLKDGGNSFSSSPAPPPPPYTPPPPVPKSSQNSEKKSSSKGSSKSSEGNKSVLNGGAIAGIVIACILGVMIVALIAAYFRWKPRDYINDEEKLQSTTPVLGSLTPDTQVEEKHESRATLLPLETVLKPPPSESVKDPVIEKFSGRKGSSRRGKNPISALTYSVADLQLATNSFSEERLIGEGALGGVYRAELPSGKILAVKKIDTSSSSLDEDFMEIVSSISRLRHANITELVGYCFEHGQRLLVYEYFSKGALSDTLHIGEDSTKRELTWNTRVKIALGTARALEYLHEACQPVVVHKNFKSANILLDEELNPHLSDCGISALSSNPELQASTMVGSSGYSAPEYTMSGIYTWQSDVYSFGVVMLELLTGRKPMDSTRPRAERSLVRWATPQLHDIDALANMVDPSLNGAYPAKSLSRFADIIALCVQPEMEFRPPMSEVVQSLVRLMQRATLSKRRSSEEQRGSNTHDPSDV